MTNTEQVEQELRKKISIAMRTVVVIPDSGEIIKNDYGFLRELCPICNEQIVPQYRRSHLSKAHGYNNREAAIDKIVELVREAFTNGAISENQMYLDRINNFKPKPGEVTAASFGSAGAGMVEAGWKHAFENRLDELKSNPTGGLK